MTNSPHSSPTIDTAGATAARRRRATTTRSKLLVGGALLVGSVGAGLGVVNFGLDDSNVNADAMTGDVRAIVVNSDSG
jgi:hypothetical protein